MTCELSGHRLNTPQVQLCLMWVVFLSWWGLAEWVQPSSATLHASVPTPCHSWPEIFLPFQPIRDDRKSSSFGYLANLQSSWATFASDSRTSVWMVGIHLFSLLSLEQLQLHGWCFWTWSRLVPGGLANSYCQILLTPVRISSGLYLGNTPCQTAPSPLVTLVHTALSTEWPILIFSWVCDNCSFGVWGGDASQA